MMVTTVTEFLLLAHILPPHSSLKGDELIDIINKEKYKGEMYSNLFVENYKSDSFSRT